MAQLWRTNFGFVEAGGAQKDSDVGLGRKILGVKFPGLPNEK